MKHVNKEKDSLFPSTQDMIHLIHNLLRNSSSVSTSVPHQEVYNNI